MRTRGLDALEFRRGQLVRWAGKPGLFEVFRAEPGTPGVVVRDGGGVLHVAIRQALRLTDEDPTVRRLLMGKTR